jgi:hypothetical protein
MDFKKKPFGLPAPLWRAVLVAVLAMILVLGVSLLQQWNSSILFWLTLGTGIVVYLVIALLPVFSKN